MEPEGGGTAAYGVVAEQQEMEAAGGGAVANGVVAEQEAAGVAALAGVMAEQQDAGDAPNQVQAPLAAAAEDEEGGHQHDDDTPDQEQVDLHPLHAVDAPLDAAVEGQEGGQLTDDLLLLPPHPHLPAAPALHQPGPAARVANVEEEIEQKEEIEEIQQEEEVLIEQKEEVEIVASATIPASTCTQGEIGVEVLAPPLAAEANPPPTAAPTGHQQQQIDLLSCILAGVTMFVLGAVLVAEMGTDITTWITTIQMMTPMRWTHAAFVAIGDISSLFLTYDPA